MRYYVLRKCDDFDLMCYPTGDRSEWRFPRKCIRMVSTTPDRHIQGVGLWWRWDHWLGAECNRILKITGNATCHWYKFKVLYAGLFPPVSYLISHVLLFCGFINICRSTSIFVDLMKIAVSRIHKFMDIDPINTMY